MLFVGLFGEEKLIEGHKRVNFSSSDDNLVALDHVLDVDLWSRTERKLSKA